MEYFFALHLYRANDAKEVVGGIVEHTAGLKCRAEVSSWICCCCCCCCFVRVKSLMGKRSCIHVVLNLDQLILVVDSVMEETRIAG